MKRVLVFLMAALLVVLTACGKKELVAPEFYQIGHQSSDGSAH